MKKKYRVSFKKTIGHMAQNYYRHGIGINSAALAYYFMFALFPLLIFISNLLGLLNLNIYSITHTLGKILPSAIVGIIETYFEYVTSTSNHTLLWFSLVFSIWFPLRAVQGLMGDVRRAYGLGMPKRIISYTIKQLIFTIVFLAVIILTLLLSLMGENVITFIINLFPKSTFDVSEYVLGIWQYIRFLPIAALMFATIGVLYAMALEHIKPVKDIMPGITLSLISWLVVSIGFSFYVENFAHYSLIYGTIGAVVILLIWLYLTSLILILGAEFNAALEYAKEEAFDKINESIMENNISKRHNKTE